MVYMALVGMTSPITTATSVGRAQLKARKNLKVHMIAELSLAAVNTLEPFTHVT